jgi:hypothetical protein
LRGRELLAANAIALIVGLALYFAFRPPHALPLAGLFLAGCLVGAVVSSHASPYQDSGCGTRCCVASRCC